MRGKRDRREGEELGEKEMDGWMDGFGRGASTRMRGDLWARHRGKEKQMVCEPFIRRYLRKTVTNKRKKKHPRKSIYFVPLCSFCFFLEFCL